MSLWKIIIGPNKNGTCKIDNKFIYKHYKNINQPSFDLYKMITSMAHHYHDIILKVYNNKSSIIYHQNRYDYQNPNDQIFHIRSNTISEWFDYCKKIKSNDIVIATDSSQKDDVTGIGVFILDKSNAYCYSQSLGRQTNHYGELYAIHKGLFLLDHFLIQTTHRRIVLFTDSISNYNPLIIPPNNIQNKVRYPSLYKLTSQLINKFHPTLWKIKSHTNPPQIFNYYADKLAEIGRMNPINTILLPSPLPNSIQYSSVNHYQSAKPHVIAVRNPFCVRAETRFALQRKPPERPSN